MDKLFIELRDIRTKIHGLCEAGKCEHITKCKKNSTVCTKELDTNKRRLVINNGGDFDRYILIRNNIIRSNRALAIKQACGMGCHPSVLNDLIQEGYLGLIMAVERFDTSVGTQFSTYAYGHIRKMILNYTKDNNIVRRKGQLYHLTKAVRRAYDRLVQGQREITAETVVEEITRERESRGMGLLLGKTIAPHIVAEEVSALITQSRFAFGTVKPLVEEKVSTQEHGEGLYSVLNKELDDELSRFSTLTSEIVRLRFGLGSYTRPATLGETGAILGITRQAVEQRVSKFFARKKT